MKKVSSPGIDRFEPVLGRISPWISSALMEIARDGDAEAIAEAKGS